MAGSNTTNRKQQPTVGEALVKLLDGYGVSHIAGIPGVHNIELYRGLSQSPLQHVLVRHEQNAGFIADGFARTARKPAVCFAISGPGVTNLLTPMGQAYSDSVPMLVIASTLEAPDRGMSNAGQGRGRLHEMKNQRLAAETVCAWAATAEAAADIPDLIAAAFNSFRTQRPRPIYIEIPIDLIKQPLDDKALESWQPKPLAEPFSPNPGQISDAANLLRGAQKPVIVAGGGAIDASMPLVKLCEFLGAALVTTIAGKGIVPSDHPNAIPYPISHPAAQSVVEDSDGLLIVGSELAETDLWRDAPLSLTKNLVRIDCDPLAISKGCAPSVPILADATLAVSALLDVMVQEASDNAAQASATAASKATVQAAKPMELAQNPVFHQLAQACREGLDSDAVVVSDMTQIAYAFNEIFPSNAPGSYHHPNGFGTLGYALPAAIGAKLAAPKRQVLAIAGDFGFQYTGNELTTAAEQGLGLPVLVWNNKALKMIKEGMVNAQMHPTAVEQWTPNFSDFAKACFCDYVRVENIGALASALANSFSNPRPTVIEVCESDQ